MGGITGSYIFIDSEAPTYPTGYGSSVAFAAAGVVAATALEALLWNENRKKAAITDAEIHENYTDEELYDMGDKSPLFKYTL